jgi:hypothetical protein
MAAIKPFNPNEHEPSKPFEPIPNGTYLAAIVESASKETQDRRGAYVALAFEILEGSYKGRKVFVNLNLENPSAEAVRFAMADLCAICLACGVRETVHDTVALHNWPLQIVVKVKPRKAKPGQPDTGELQNAVAEYRRRDGSKITTGPASAAQPSVPTDAGAPPWKR